MMGTKEQFVVNNNQEKSDFYTHRNFNLKNSQPLVYFDQISAKVE